MVALIALFLLSIVMIWCFRIYAIKRNILDKPNERSSHITPTPLGGGVIFAILFVAYLLLNYFFGVVNAKYLLIFIPGVLILGVIGFLDDCFGIKARWRFLVQFVLATYTLCLLGNFHIFHVGIWSIYLGWFGFVLAVLNIVWSANLYNFMDGIDGIAAIEALFVFGCGGCFIWHAGGFELAKLIWAMAVIVAGFLVWNRPPAKIFMGDAGSALLGFLVILFGIVGEMWYQVPLLLWLILYGVFWFDATITLVRRVIHGDVWYQPHRLHAFQRLHLVGWSHQKILLGIIIINFLLMVLALLASYIPFYAPFLLLLATLILLVIYLLIEKVKPMYKK